MSNLPEKQALKRRNRLVCFSALCKLSALAAYCLFMVVFTGIANVYAEEYADFIIQDSEADVFLGTITEIIGDEITIEVARSLFECYEVLFVTVNKFEYMTDDYEHTTPAVGDYCAVAVTYSDGMWKILYENYPMAVKSDSLEQQTLTLFTGGNIISSAMNRHINEGIYSKEVRALELRNVEAQDGEQVEEILTVPGEGTSENRDIMKEQREPELFVEVATAHESSSQEEDASPLDVPDDTNKNRGRMLQYISLTLGSFVMSLTFVKLTQHRKKNRR